MGEIVTPKEAIAREEGNILGGIWKLMDEADIIIGQNCVSVDTPILTQQLEWVAAGELKTGDKIVGFEEKRAPEETKRDENGNWRGVNGKKRKLLPTTVTNCSIQKKPCLKIHFDNGDGVVVTNDHYWLGKAERDKNLRWYRSDRLRIGQRIPKFFDVWERDLSYDAGWLSGFISGEGTLKQSGSSFAIDFCQRPGTTWNQALTTCNRLSFPVSNTRTNRKSGIGKQDVLYTGFLGGKSKAMEIIGRLQIRRFIEKINWNNIGGLAVQNRKDSKIIEIEDIGYQDVAVFSTDTKTFIGAGYAMHNCSQFDLKRLNTKFLKYNYPPPSFYSVVDTLKVAREKFAFTSNSLDELGKTILGIGGKTKMTIEDWDACAEGSKDGLAKMLKYCKRDVAPLLEDLYLKFLPWIPGHPNLNIFTEHDKDVCPKCESGDLSWSVQYQTPQGLFQGFRCSSCGATGRGTAKEHNIKRVSIRTT